MKPKMLIPMLVCHDPAAEIEFCRQAFGAEELSCRKDTAGKVIHATLRIHDSLLMIHDASERLSSKPPKPDGSSPVVTFLYGSEVDPIMARSVSLGARILMPAENQTWGDRVGRIVDPAGHVWNIAARLS